MATAKKETKSADFEPVDAVFGAKVQHDAWKCEVRRNAKGEAIYEKLKIERKEVGITVEQAEILNEGALNGGNNIITMYFVSE